MVDVRKWESPEQQARWERLAALAEGQRPARQAELAKLTSAIAARGFVGDLRREVLASRREWGVLAGEIHVEPQTIYSWMCGEAELPSGTIERLVELLGLHLVPIDSSACD